MKNILAFLFGLAILTPVAAARAETVGAGCTWSASVECSAACNPSVSSFSCDVDLPKCEAELPTKCEAELQVSASCAVDCQATCEGKCNVDPPSFSCEGECQATLRAECEAKINANCDAQCGGSSDSNCQAKCQGELKAGCQTTGSATCKGSCNAKQGEIDCKASCEGSCSGSCNADAKAKATCNGYLQCDSAGKLECQTDFQANCKGQCESSGGALVCNGKVVTFGTLDDAKAWFKANVKVTSRGSASCDNGTCQAEGEASASCSATNAPVGSGAGAALGLLGMAYGASRLRRRSRLPAEGRPGPPVLDAPTVDRTPVTAERSCVARPSHPPLVRGGGEVPVVRLA